MSNCKYCNKPIETHTGRMPKKFCDKACRVAYFNANKPKERAMVKKATYDAVVAERDYYKAIVLNSVPTLPHVKEESSFETNDVQSELNKYQEELSKLGTGQFATQRRKQLEKRINDLKKQLQ